ncbi:MAG: penicillin-binding transpeptidase domain-containing protein [Maledivibacter sp.]|jgi:peptidoglycan glycosyltransferase/penicillin-binding protein 2|nr:penicillin-binding transpeptidase domain-containing protein [Maledivibacter sp.]
MDKTVKEKRRVKNNDGLKEKRIFTVFGAIGLVLCLLIIRLFYIQIIKGDEYSKKAFEQWFRVTQTIADRGTIYDTNGKSLTNKGKESYLILDPGFNLSKKNIDTIVELTGLSREEIANKILKDKKTELLINNYDENLIKKMIRNIGVSTVERSRRYAEGGLASHVIGYVNKSKNNGVSGLEKSFDKELVENREKRIGAILDAHNRIIPGYGYILIESDEVTKKNIITTLDSDIQKICESELDKNNYIGSVVVLDSKSGDILAMASRPNFDQGNIEAHLDSKSKELYNKAVQISYPPGSVFKIVVAAALLENDVIDLSDKSICKGYEMLGVNMIKCNSYKRGGHGELSFEDAFTLSCNSIFIQATQALGGERLLEMAEKCGIGKKTGIKIDEEVGGILPSQDYVKGPGIGNIAIGQGTVEVTPLQVARFTNIIANDGIDVGVRLVKGLTDSNGKILDKYNDKEINRVVSSDTATKIKRMMRKVVKEGTGKRANIDGTETYGKTGSAEAVGKNGETVHAWFTGFFLGKKSEYVVTVIVEEKGSGGKIATPIFSNIAKNMLGMGM